MTSPDWQRLFATRRDCAALLPWSDPYRLTARETRLVAASLQQFQLGEGSEGSGLVRRARASRPAAADPAFVRALELFIAEERRHSRTLARFLGQQGIPCLSRHWVDGVFRRVRKLAGLELCLTVLVTAEIIAMPYYKALAGATRSTLLAAICAQVLRDERDHLRYQAQNLGALRAWRRRWPALEWLAWRGFMRATLAVVWRHHGRVLRAGGYSRKTFRQECMRWLRAVDREEFELPAAEPAAPKGIAASAAG